MTESQYTIVLSNAERIMLRRMLREQIQAENALCALAVRQRNFAQAESIAENIGALQSAYDKVRAMVPGCNRLEPSQAT